MKAQGRVICLALGLALLGINLRYESVTANAATVYECVVGAQRVFSDQPCAQDAVQREIAEPNRMAGPGVTHDMSAASRKTAPKRSDAANDEVVQRKARCNKLRAQQRAIQEQMRSGYNAAQGERLRQRAQALTADYVAQRCERYR